MVYSSFRKYAQFHGRADQAEFACWCLFTWGWAAIVGALDLLQLIDGLLLLALVGAAMLLPTMAVIVRRLHDIDRSGWFLLALIVPVAGFYVLYFLVRQPGTPGANRYGAEPSAKTAVLG